MTGGPAVLGLGNGAVLLRGLAVVDTSRAVALAIDTARRRDGMTAPGRLVTLAAVLNAEAAQVVAGWPHRDSRPGDVVPTSAGDVLTTTEVAQVLGISERTVRRRAGDLGGQLVAGRYVFDRAAVADRRTA